MRPMPPARLGIRLLGTFETTLDGVSLAPFRSDKVRALLAYLAVEANRPHRRAALATLLWGEYAGPDANHSLRQALANLRSLLAPLSPSALTSTGQEVELHVEPGRVWVDVHAFDALQVAADPRYASAFQAHDPAGALAQAMALYRGPFLAGLTLPDSPEFEEWRLLHQEQRHQTALLALERLVSIHLALGQTVEVARYARQQLALEPWSEGAHRSLMLVLALEGQRGAALRQYKECRRVLAEELGATPCAETETLARQIREGEVAWIGRRSQDEDSETALPPRPFVAREQELARLDGFLGQVLAGQGRVIFVVGESGSGKTTLLAHFARRAIEYHRNLVVAGGRCSAYAGSGDPFLPFRQILQILCGEAEASWPTGCVDSDNGRRLRAMGPQAAEVVLRAGPDLIGRLVSGQAFEARAAGSTSPNAPWRARLEGRSAAHQVGRASPLQLVALFNQVTGVLRALARQQPLVLLLDDLQWIDRASLSLLFHLARQLEGTRVLIAGAYRPSEVGTEPTGVRDTAAPKLLTSVVHECMRQWGDVIIDLDQADGRRFVDAVLDSEPNRLGAPFRETLTRHTGGHALFTIELLRAFHERGELVRDESGHWVEATALRWGTLPPRVEAVIAERLGRLPPEWRRALEIASVEGDSFSAEVVARALGADPASLVEGLSGFLSSESKLVQAQGVHPLAQKGQSVSRYRFGHVLFRDYLYTHLDAVQQAQHHGAVGKALESLCAGDDTALAAASASLARHFETACLPLKAASYRLEAGRWAARLVAYDEAIAHFECGLALLEGVTPSRERLRLELGLWVAMGTPAMLQWGWQAPVFTRALERLSDLIQHPDLQQDPQRLAALSVLALSAAWSANPMLSESVGQQLLDLVPTEASGQAPAAGSAHTRDGDQQTLLLGHWALGFSHWLRGQPVSALEHLRRAVALVDPETSHHLGAALAGETGVMARAMLGAVQWQLGYPDQARACFRQAVAHAEALKQPASTAFAHYIAAMVISVLGRDLDAALHHAEALQPLGQVSLVYRAWAETLAGQMEAQRVQAGAGVAETGTEKGLVRMVAAGSNWEAAGAGAGYAGLMLLEAEVCARAGHVEMGLEAIRHAQAWIERTGMRATEADVWRMRGELLLQESDRSRSTGTSEPASPLACRAPSIIEAEACFDQALDIAREQRARIFELRAAMSLARLWRAQGRRDEARELLVGIYGWFTEGFDTLDLIEAKALLNELA